MSSGNLIMRPSCTSYSASIQSGMAHVAGLRVAQRVLLGADEGGDALAQLHRDDLLVGEVQHLELVEHLVDGADLVAARVPGADLGRPVVLELLDPRAGLLDHFACTTMKIDVPGGSGVPDRNASTASEKVKH